MRKVCLNCDDKLYQTIKDNKWSWNEVLAFGIMAKNISELFRCENKPRNLNPPGECNDYIPTPEVK